MVGKAQSTKRNSMSTNISHATQHASLEEAIAHLKSKIQKRGDLPYATVDQQLTYVDELSQFPLGRFLMQRGGLNGFWTHYVLLEGRYAKDLPPLADILIKKTPIAIATQQRFDIFQTITQKYVKEGCVFASIPCGVMGDLLTLDYTQVKNFKLIGIDIDAESLSQAAEFAAKKGLKKHVEFLEKDAWKLNKEAAFDLVTSNGLNIYESDPQKLLKLYEQFYRSLKPGGVLVTSFLTQPGEWQLDKIKPEHALLQKIIFDDILSANWQAFYNVRGMKELMTQAGFHNVEIHYDEAHIYPALTAEKLSK